jgi:hypothetical protein
VTSNPRAGPVNSAPAQPRDPAGRERPLGWAKIAVSGEHAESGAWRVIRGCVLPTPRYSHDPFPDDENKWTLWVLCRSNDKKLSRFTYRPCFEHDGASADPPKGDRTTSTKVGVARGAPNGVTPRCCDHEWRTAPRSSTRTNKIHPGKRPQPNHARVRRRSDTMVVIDWTGCRVDRPATSYAPASQRPADSNKSGTTSARSRGEGRVASATGLDLGLSVPLQGHHETTIRIRSGLHARAERERGPTNQARRTRPDEPGPTNQARRTRPDEPGARPEERASKDRGPMKRRRRGGATTRRGRQAAAYETAGLAWKPEGRAVPRLQDRGTRKRERERGPTSGGREDQRAGAARSRDRQVKSGDRRVRSGGGRRRGGRVRRRRGGRRRPVRCPQGWRCGRA